MSAYFSSLLIGISKWGGGGRRVEARTHIRYILPYETILISFSRETMCCHDLGPVPLCISFSFLTVMILRTGNYKSLHGT